MIKLNNFLSLLEGKTVSARFSIDWKKSFEGIKIPHRKQDCLDCKKELMCSECVVNPRMNYFKCELERACET